MKELELSLLKYWKENGVVYIYKYKHRIKFYKREGLTSIELICDLTCGLLFEDVQDIANQREEVDIDDYKVSIDSLIEKRQ